MTFYYQGAMIAMLLLAALPLPLGVLGFAYEKASWGRRLVLAVVALILVLVLVCGVMVALGASTLRADIPMNITTPLGAIMAGVITSLAIDFPIFALLGVVHFENERIHYLIKIIAALLLIFVVLFFFEIF